MKRRKVVESKGERGWKCECMTTTSLRTFTTCVVYSWLFFLLGSTYGVPLGGADDEVRRIFCSAICSHRDDDREELTWHQVGNMEYNIYIVVLYV